jgi:hypothetical protein
VVESDQEVESRSKIFVCDGLHLRQDRRTDDIKLVGLVLLEILPRKISAFGSPLLKPQYIFRVISICDIVKIL